jgi:catechol 2,3-dioxygenase-like lactoylglutathione lyase family enzyme
MLSWSHAVLYVQTLQPMLQFYSEVLGFLITDRGPLAEGGNPSRHKAFQFSQSFCVSGCRV